MQFGMTLENCEWGNIDIEVNYSEGIESITVNGKQPKGREIEMINMSLQEIQEETAWRIYQDTKEVEYENRLFMGRVCG